MTRTHVSAQLLAAMGDLLAGTRAATLDFDTPGAGQARETRDEVADQLSDYILPRLVQLDAPLLTVVGGSTGAGKSTLVSSIVGAPVTEAGVLRPTTRSPVLVHHPDDADWFVRERVLPDLPRHGDQDGSVTYGLRLVATDSIPRGLAILDAPDVDSIDEVNRELATQLLAAADLWLFVTSAARYADQVPWSYLKRAADRSASLAVVLDRTADDAVEEVRGHLARMMTARGLADSPLFTVPESILSHTGLLPSGAVAPIAGWLRDLAADPAARRTVIGRTLDGAVRHAVFRAHDIADALDEQVAVAARLGRGVDEAYVAARADLPRQLTDGSVISGEVDACWRTVSAGLGRAAAAPTAAVEGIDDLRRAVTASVVSTMLASAGRAAQAVGDAWAADAEGRRLLSSAADLDRASNEVSRAAAERVAAWVGTVEDRVRSAGSYEAAELDRLAACTVVATVAGPDHAAGAAARDLLQTAWGAERATSLVASSVDELRVVAGEVLALDRLRLEQLAPSADTIAAQQTNLRSAARAAEYARHADFVNGEIAP